MNKYLKIPLIIISLIFIIILIPFTSNSEPITPFIVHECNELCNPSLEIIIALVILTIMIFGVIYSIMSLIIKRKCHSVNPHQT